LADAIEADFSANLESNLKPFVVSAGEQIGAYLAEGIGGSDFAGGIIATILEQLADAVAPQGAGAGGVPGAGR
jgi:hypothetical protein